MRIQMEIHRIWKTGSNGLFSYESHKESSMENACRRISTPHATVCHWHERRGWGIVGEGCQWSIAFVSFPVIFHFFFQPTTTTTTSKCPVSHAGRSLLSHEVEALWFCKFQFKSEKKRIESEVIEPHEPSSCTTDIAWPLSRMQVSQQRNEFAHYRHLYYRSIGIMIGSIARCIVQRSAWNLPFCRKKNSNKVGNA